MCFFDIILGSTLADGILNVVLKISQISIDACNAQPFLSCRHSIYFLQGYQKSEVGFAVRRCPPLMKISFDG